MHIIELKERMDISEDVKMSRIYIQFQELLKELQKKELPNAIIEFINQDIEDLNSVSLTSNEFEKLVKQKQTKIIKQIEKELKIVPKNYYRNLWLALGLCVFGIPIGIALRTSANNAGLFALGIPIGMGIGIALGTGMDKKAFKEGRQLDIEVK